MISDERNSASYNVTRSISIIVADLDRNVDQYQELRYKDKAGHNNTTSKEGAKRDAKSQRTSIMAEKRLKTGKLSHSEEKE